MTSRSDKTVCAKCKRKFDPLTLLRCRYSKKGAVVCYWCCRQCPYIRRVDEHLQCGYENKKEEHT